MSLVEVYCTLSNVELSVLLVKYTIELKQSSMLGLGAKAAFESSEYSLYVEPIKSDWSKSL